MNDNESNSSLNADHSPTSAGDDLKTSPVGLIKKSLLLNPKDSSQADNKFKETYKILWWCAFQVSICTSINSMVYPAVAQATNLKFLSDSTSQKAWVVVIISLFYGLFDTVGSFVAQIFPLFNQKNIILLTMFKLIFIPTFLLISKLNSPSWLFGADYFKLLNCISFGFTNGYLISRLMVLGPEMVPLQLKETAGMIMNFHQIGGIFVGSLIAAFIISWFF